MISGLYVGKMLLRAIPDPASEAPSRSCDIPPRVSGEAPCRGWAERKQLIEDWLAARGRDLVGLHRTYGISRETRHRRVQRFPPGGYPSRSGRCKGVTQRAGLTLLHPLSTAKIINVVAGWLPLSAKPSAHPDVPVSQGTTAKPPSRPAEGARSSVPSVTDH